MNVVKFKISQLFLKTTKQYGELIRTFKSKLGSYSIAQMMQCVEFQAFSITWLLSSIGLWAKYQTNADSAIALTALWLICHLPVVYNIHMYVTQHQLRQEIQRLRNRSRQEWQTCIQTGLAAQNIDRYDAIRDHLSFLKNELFNCNKIWLRCCILFLGLSIIFHAV